MHLSAQEEYGLRCLVQLARHVGEEPMRIQEIARAEGLSSEYVAKLMRILRNGNLVDSTRGASGGYRLPQADERRALEREGEKYTAQLKKQAVTFRADARRWLSHELRMTLEGAEANISLLGNQLRKLNEEQGGLQLQ